MKLPTTKQLKMALDLALDVSISYTIEGCWAMGMSKNQNHFSTQEQRVYASNLILIAITNGVKDD